MMQKGSSINIGIKVYLINFNSNLMIIITNIRTKGVVHETRKGSIRHCKFKTMTNDIVDALYFPFR
jgi:hypothetical protein